jgi:DNA-binding NarL/FixJ family response regulator
MHLTPREQEVARLVREGFSNPEIATLLGIRHQSVKNHLYSVFNKAGIGSRYALIARFVMDPVSGEIQRKCEG